MPPITGCMTPVREGLRLVSLDVLPAHHHSLVRRGWAAATLRRGCHRQKDKAGRRQDPLSHDCSHGSNRPHKRPTHLNLRSHFQAAISYPLTRRASWPCRQSSGRAHGWEPTWDGRPGEVPEATWLQAVRGRQRPGGEAGPRLGWAHR